MKVRPFLHGVRTLLTSALAALLLWLVLCNSPLWPHDAEAAPPTVLAHVSTGGQGEADLSKKPKLTPEEQKEQQKEKEAKKERRTALDHVLDSPHWELFESFGQHEFYLPKILGFQITKYMVLEVVAALLIIAIYVPLAWRMQHSHVPTGTYANFFEVFLTFIRDQVAKPGLGEHDADKHVPFLWTLFLFILFNNLLGMVPFFGSPTASIFVTGALALCVFFYMHGFGVGKFGFKHYVMSLWPHIDVPFPMGYFIKPLIFAIEWIGTIVRNIVLAVRLFANMFAGHMVTATFLLFIWMAQNAHPVLWGAVTATSVLGIVALSLLELFVAFLQAYIFTFLTALFMGMALHPEH
jgi:F-type H+-transporting ATPase subunit a